MSGSAQGSSSSFTGTTLVSPFWSTMDGTEVERSSALFMFTFQERAARCRMQRQIPAANMAANDVTLASPQRTLSGCNKEKSKWRCSSGYHHLKGTLAKWMDVVMQAKRFIYAAKEKSTFAFFLVSLSRRWKELPET